MESSDTWQETAQRLAAHPEFPDTELFELLPERGHYLGRKNGIPVVIPDLTDWATVGVITGMVVEILNIPSAFMWVVRYWDEHERNFDIVPGQALAELWLGLKGDIPF